MSAFATDSQAEAIARSHVKALNTGDPISIQNWIDSNCPQKFRGWGKDMVKVSKDLAPMRFHKVVFAAAYEIIAEITDRKHRTDHITFFLNSKGKVRWLRTYLDLPVKSETRPEIIASSHVDALNRGDAASIHHWIAAYSSDTGWDKWMLDASKALAPLEFKKLIFSAPYEIVAETTDRRHHTDHITFFLNSKDKVRDVIAYPD